MKILSHLCVWSILICICSASDALVKDVMDYVQEVESGVTSEANWKEQGKKFEEFMLSLGAEIEGQGEEVIEELDPAEAGDRIRLIALDFLRNKESYVEIYDEYVRHPTEAEIEKKREDFIAKHGGPSSDDPFGGVGSNVVKADPTFPAPSQIGEKHLKENYQYCFEYFWLAPRKEETMKGYRETLANALDLLKDANGDQPDIRDLLK
ncbi:hypothetical protein [Roseibacillus ishigakijimensis]|uniref:Uncharacterized protein n=1 Tax=Roseibacillus ishigakijimensis TaxID=454146 RepID=A0A934RPB4_9BACT|nr:hypothetical protein [Roseibacillus ishigakijimensis]MBK1833008.1 hypothetical protein [Roseibacillus ishigakijimensis]